VTGPGPGLGSSAGDHRTEPDQQPADDTPRTSRLVSTVGDERRETAMSSVVSMLMGETRRGGLRDEGVGPIAHLRRLVAFVHREYPSC
jgi:hypothetical protein